MTFQTLRSQLSHPSWLQIPQELVQHQGVVSISKNESRSLLQEARTAIDSGHLQDAQNALYAGLLLDEERFLHEVQKTGLLRISRLSYVAEPLTSLVSSLLAPSLGLSAATVDYLESVSNLYEVATRVRKEYQQLEGWLANEREVGIKSALAWLDFLFLKISIGVHGTSKVEIPSRNPFFFTIEELAEGFSSLLALYGNEIGTLTQNPAINEQALLDGAYLAILNTAAHVSTFREWEFQVDRLGYRFVSTGPVNEFRLEHPSAEFHRAIEMGFIQVTQQRLKNTHECLNLGGKSFSDYAPTLVKQMEDAGFIKMVERPVARIQFAIPGEVLKLTARVDAFFLEERIALLQASRDLLTPPQQILDFEVQDGVTFRDLFQVSRMIHFIRSIAAAKLIPELESRPGLVFQSIVPAFERGQLVELLSNCVTKEIAEKVVAMWTADIKGHVDIQYWPMVPMGTTILLPANVFAGANVYRNPLQILRTRLYPDGKNDPLAPLLANKFIEKGYDARIGFNYAQGEIDVLVMIDGILFAFECKNSLVPSGAHELMTSLDYVRTASDQLERFTNRFTDPKFRDWLKKETGWPIDHATHLSTGIVLSNRMFMGLREEGHPVRGAYELEHFVDEGTIAMGEEIHHFWQGANFGGDDLRRFLESDITYQAQWNCLLNHDAKYEFDDCTVVVGHLHLDLPSLADHFGFEKAKQGLEEQQAAYEKFVKEFSLVNYYKERYQEDGGNEE